MKKLDVQDISFQCSISDRTFTLSPLGTSVSNPWNAHKIADPCQCYIYFIIERWIFSSRLFFICNTSQRYSFFYVALKCPPLFQATAMASLLYSPSPVLLLTLYAQHYFKLDSRAASCLGTISEFGYSSVSWLVSLLLALLLFCLGRIDTKACLPRWSSTVAFQRYTFLKATITWTELKVASRLASIGYWKDGSHKRSCTHTWKAQCQHHIQLQFISISSPDARSSSQQALVNYTLL